nr:MAG TPA: hypothetical protein [Caudoviricetes sp.]
MPLSQRKVNYGKTFTQGEFLLSEASIYQFKARRRVLTWLMLSVSS